VESEEMMTRTAALRSGLVLIWLLACGSGVAGAFRASIVKVDITPAAPQWLLGFQARQSTGVHDHIYHRIAVLDDGKTQLVVVSSDVCHFSPALYDGFAARLERETGIHRVQLLWTTTHTHSAPEVGPPGMGKVFLGQRYDHDYDHAYTEFVQKSLIDGIQDARRKLTPATLEAGTGMAMANINRRAPNGKGGIALGLNPYGPADRQIGLLRLKRSDGSLLGLIVNYAMHGTVLGGTNLLISGDAPGIVAAYVEEKLGAPMLYINGAAGNMAPLYTGRENFASSHIGEFNVLLGDRILAANRDMAPRVQSVELQAVERIVETPRANGLGWDDSLRAYLRTSDDGTAMVRLPVRFLKVSNEVAIWSAPVELFCEIAMQIREASPFPFTFYYGYANGWLGYFPTRQAFQEGGYEPKTSPFTGRAEADLLAAVTGYLQGMIR
jgi:neutral ceramidase